MVDDEIKSTGVRAQVFGDTQAELPVDGALGCVQGLAGLAVERGHRMGGASCLDMAKVVALLLTQGGRPRTTPASPPCRGPPSRWSPFRPRPERDPRRRRSPCCPTPDRVRRPRRPARPAVDSAQNAHRVQELSDDARGFLIRAAWRNQQLTPFIGRPGVGSNHFDRSQCRWWVTWWRS